MAARQSECSLEEKFNLYQTSLFDTDPARVEALRETGLLDTAAESRFDSLTSLAASLFDVPVAIVTLIDANRAWFKSSIGDFQGEAQREYSACSYISVPDFAEMVVSEQCNNDSRYSENPFIKGPPDLRYYVGCPLVTSTGQRLGTFCLCDFRPRRFSSSAYNVLANLAEIVAREAERDVVKVATVLAPAAEEAIFMVDVSKPNWPLVYCNQAWVGLFNLDADPLELEDQGIWEVLGVEAPENDVIAAKKSVLTNGDPANIFLKVAARGKDANPPHLIHFRCFLAGQDHLHNCVPVGIPAIVKNFGCDLEALSVPLADLWIGTAHKLLVNGSEGAFAKAELLKTDVAVHMPSDGAIVAVLPQQQQHRLINHNAVHAVGVSLAVDLQAEKVFHPRYPQAMKPAPTRKRHRLSDLKLGVLLGVGAYGRVYRAMLGNKSVAVKIIEVFAEDEEEVDSDNNNKSEKFPVLHHSKGSSGSSGGRGSGSRRSTECNNAMLEGVLSKDLVFPTIVPTFDYLIQESTGEDSSIPGTKKPRRTQQVWILQHLCDLGSLYQALDRGMFREEPLLNSPPCLSKILATALDIATAMRYLHERDIIHSDLNGNNVLMSTTNNDRGFIALVSDFGLSKIVAEQINTKTVGTISHQPPELLSDGRLTKKADTFAFGVLLFELWTGKRAFAGKALGYIILQISCGKKCYVLNDSRCPDALKQLVDDCINFDDEGRPTFEVVVSRLEEMIKEYC